MPGPTGRGTDMMSHRLTISTPAGPRSSHGMSNFPDPIFAPRGGVKTPGSKVNHDSPALEAAAKACRHVGMGIPGGG